MKSKILSITSALLLIASCSNNYKITNKGTFVSKFEKDNSFVVSDPDAAYLVANTNFYLVLQSGIKKDTIQYMSLILSGDLQVGDSIWVYTNRHKQIKAANYCLK